MTRLGPKTALRRASDAFSRAGWRAILTGVWSGFWMLFAHYPVVGSVASRLATWWIPPYYGRHRLAGLSARGFVDPRARINHPDFRRGRHVFIGERVTIYRDRSGGHVRLGDNVSLENDVCIQTGDGGSVELGSGTHVQPRCQLSAYVADIRIGRNVQIAPGCGFYPYDHGTEPGLPMHKQPLVSKGSIVVEDEAWLGYGAIMLAGTTIGRGAVIGAGSVVTRDVPANSVAIGNPARVVRTRQPSPIARDDPPMK